MSKSQTFEQHAISQNKHVKSLYFGHAQNLESPHRFHRVVSSTFQDFHFLLSGGGKRFSTLAI
jgi:hypothetical protein